jgi:serine/threonine protein kinase
MGEVYRATDTKLKREVAIKLVPEAFIQDPERLARRSLTMRQKNRIVERPHQGFDGAFIQPANDHAAAGLLARRERLGGLLNY